MVTTAPSQTKTEPAAFMKASVPLALAQHLIERATARAMELGIQVSVVIVDESGVLKAFARMDGAPLVSVEVARKKALTAVGFQLPTGQPWLDFSAGDIILEKGLQYLPDFVLFSGGHPIRLADQSAGAIGVSGSHYAQDDECAKAALSVLS